MNSMVFGKYIPVDSVLHRNDPRAKIIAMFILLVAIFLPAGWWAYLLLGAVLLLGLALSKLKLSFILKSFKPMMFMMFFLLIVNILSVHTGDLWLTLGPVTVYSDAVLNTLYIVVRLILMIMLTTMLTATTKPLELTLGLEYLMKPLHRIGVPTHEIAMMISIALRFIPTIIEETMRIMNAQKSRGVDFDEGKLKEKIMAVLSLIVPLFSVAFQRADDLANAMEARGYVPGAERTRYKKLQYAGRDWFLLLFCLAVLAAVIALVILL
ncbi:MAG: energy-coupling factor transporter transmembrane protein EcfT [Erysipelotrichaceae bacterium]|nr:energy-coupling factor transporter transmembrane protein EcfT [Erysipelotrichaceae bacterium]